MTLNKFRRPPLAALNDVMRRVPEIAGVYIAVRFKDGTTGTVRSGMTRDEVLKILVNAK